MGEETEIRQEEAAAKQQTFFRRHLSKLLITLLTAGAGAGGTYGVDLVGDIKDELSAIKQEQALQNQKVDNLRQEQMEHIWRMLYIHEGQIENNTIEVGALERFIALAMSEGNITPEDTAMMFDAMKELLEEEEFEFSAEQIEGFRNMQQQYDEFQQKK